jgi:hypothetical protein
LARIGFVGEGGEAAWLGRFFALFCAVMSCICHGLFPTPLQNGRDWGNPQAQINQKFSLAQKIVKPNIHAGLSGCHMVFFGITATKLFCGFAEPRIHAICRL